MLLNEDLGLILVYMLTGSDKFALNGKLIRRTYPRYIQANIVKQVAQAIRLCDFPLLFARFEGFIGVATATSMPQNKRFNEQSNGCARAL